MPLFPECLLIALHQNMMKESRTMHAYQEAAMDTFGPKCTKDFKFSAVCESSEVTADGLSTTTGRFNLGRRTGKTGNSSQQVFVHLL